MNNAQLLAAVRALIMLIGSYFIGKMFFGLPIDQVLWQQITGVVLTIVAFVWSWATNALTQTVTQGLIRQTITFIGGILLAKGVITKELWDSILSILVSVLPFLQSLVAKKGWS